MILLLTTGALLSIAMFIVGLGSLLAGSGGSRSVAGAVDDDRLYGQSRMVRWDRAFRKTSLGQYMAREITAVGLTTRPLVVLIVLVAVSVVVPYILWTLLAPAFGVVGLLAGVVAFRVWLTQAKQRRIRKFVQQVPDIARVLSSATGAGLSINSAWKIAEQEMSEPAQSEIARINEAVKYGRSLEDAQLELAKRLPSREVNVLTSTLVISARSGGSLVGALRDISTALEDRREVKREIQTTLAESTATGYLIASITLGVLLLLNTMNPGTVEKMTTSVIGQVALAVSFALTALGVIIMRRMAKIDI